jgi:hypothetical protein
VCAFRHFSSLEPQWLGEKRTDPALIPSTSGVLLDACWLLLSFLYDSWWFLSFFFEANRCCILGRCIGIMRVLILFGLDQSLWMYAALLSAQ